MWVASAFVLTGWGKAGETSGPWQLSALSLGLCSSDLVGNRVWAMTTQVQQAWGPPHHAVNSEFNT